VLIKKAPDIKWSEITDKKLYMNRRQFIAGTSALGASALLVPSSIGLTQEKTGTQLKVIKRGEYSVPEKLSSYEDAAGYTNYYEFSTSKRGPTKLAQGLKTKPWSISIEGEVEKPFKIEAEDLTAKFPLEERIYRWRCVEAWSMVIPWIGFPLKDLIKFCKPTSKANFVEFTTLMDREQMPGLKQKVLPWPYAEGLRMDEAQHPLSLMVVGMYDEALPNQNGAPLRLVVPWKYGFKGAKSIVRIRFTEKMPRTAWNRQRPTEYGFYANVNPNVNHPRWTQATERRIGESGRRPTLMFNGYGDEVEGMYSGMDLTRYY
jgi:sulfoxide reductase catalytic subunit YedY